MAPDAHPSAPAARIPAGTVRAFAEEVLRRLNVPSDHAAYIAETLVDSDLRGHLSHGAWRLVVLANRVRAGGIDPQAPMRWLQEGPATAILDAANGLGQVAARLAMERAISQAKAGGVALVAVRNSNSFFAAKSAALLAPEAGCIGLIASTSGPLVAPWGAARPLLGNSPMAIAIPTGGRPLVLDMSLTPAARGRIVEALQAGEQLPPGWAIDQHGNSTQDPAAALKGTSTPIGGYKGYGLILVIEILAGLLSGAGWGTDVSLFQPYERPQRVGHIVLAVDVAHFMPVEAFLGRVDALIEAIKQQAPRPGFKEVLIPGERGYRSLERGEREGLAYPDYVRTELVQLATGLGIPPL